MVEWRPDERRALGSGRAPSNSESSCRQQAVIAPSADTPLPRATRPLSCRQGNSPIHAEEAKEYGLIDRVLARRFK